VKVATEDEVAADFAEYVKASKKGPVVVTSKGKPVAVLLSPGTKDDLERLLMGHAPKLQAMLEAARKRFRQGHGIPHEMFWKEVEEENPSEGTKQARTGKNGQTKRTS
jgi:prevent-host-death family protein